jgi:hypothetical protein
MNNTDFEVLNEVYKGAKMGMDAITYMTDKITNDEFSKEIKRQYNDYEEIARKVMDTVNKNSGKLDDVPTKDKLMGWTSVKMNTMMDDTTSHMAEMLIQGTVMGIVEGVKLSNKYPNLNVEAESLVDQFVKIGEDNIQVLKKYL